MSLDFWGIFGSNPINEAGMRGTEKLLCFVLTGIRQETPLYQAEQIGVVSRPRNQVPILPRSYRESEVRGVPPADLRWHHKQAKIPLVKILYSLKTMGTVRPVNAVRVVRLLPSWGSKIVIRSPHSRMIFCTDHGEFVEDLISLPQLTPTSISILKRAQSLPPGLEQLMVYEEANSTEPKRTVRVRKMRF